MPTAFICGTSRAKPLERPRWQHTNPSRVRSWRRRPGESTPGTGTSGRPAPGKGLRPATQLVHGATNRTPFGEMSEGLFLTQGYAYDTMEIAEARFKGRNAGLHLLAVLEFPPSRCSSRGWRFSKGAEAARATASGMAAVTAALMGQLRAGDHVVAARALFGSCLYVVEDLLPALRRVDDAGRWRRSRPVARGRALDDQGPVPRDADQPDAGGLRHRGAGGDRPCRRRDAGGRQRLRHADAAAPAGARRRLRGLFHDQACRRARALPGRHDPGEPGLHRHAHAQLSAPDRTGDLAVQRLG